MDPDYLPGCPFCEKLDRNDDDIALDTNRPCARFEPLNPVTPGHMLFVPTWHAEHGDMTALATAMRGAYAYATRMSGDFNLITSSGSAATQTVTHLHIHYVPRRPDDGLTLPWTGQR